MAERTVGHDAHDEDLVAALLDADLGHAERAMATAQVAGCASCANLFADLVSLSGATQVMPAAVRTRDFSLTAADAARLVGERGTEPARTPARLTGEMTDLRPTSTLGAHASHDTTLVASLSDRTLSRQERSAAEALTASCSECAVIHADLVALAVATRALPTPSRPRGYTLSAEDAARLRPAGWRRVIAAFGSPRDAFSRPLAVGLTTLGLAGLLVASGPSILQSSAGSAATGTDRTFIQAAPERQGGSEAATDGAAPAAAASANNQLPLAASIPPGAAGVTSGGEGSPEPEIAGQGDSSGAGKGANASGQPADMSTEQLEALDDTATGQSMLPLLSVLFLAIGLGLFAIRWAARRLSDG